MEGYYLKQIVTIMNVFQQLQTCFFMLSIPEVYKVQAIKNIHRWLTDSEFADYKEQILYLIENKKFELLLDSFYQIIPFGTGGRRGQVGIGTNRINPWTIQASAQGHAEYILKKYYDAEQHGVVIAYDVRKYPETDIYNPDLKNPVKKITSKDLALLAADVYTANNLPVFLFEEIRTTPELSFAVRHLNAVSGVMISASHNPKEDNGEKIYGADGSQLIPPEDQIVADAVNSVEHIKKIQNKSLIKIIGKDVDDPYITAVLEAVSCTTINNVKILYTPLHGVGSTSVYKALLAVGCDVVEDNATKTPDGFFTNVKFNIPNPEVPESFETCYNNPVAKECDLIFASDPDADRLGLSVKHDGSWHYLNGNEIGIVLLCALIAKKKDTVNNLVVAKTMVTSSLITKICMTHGINIIDNLLVGFKYIGNEIAKLEKQGKEKNFMLGLEESHGYLVGTYCRDKDAAAAAILLAELTAILKAQKKTIIDLLDETYKEYGYAENYLTSLIMQGAVGFDSIKRIQRAFREKHLEKLGDFSVNHFIDKWNGEMHISDTDTASRDVLIFELRPVEDVKAMKLIVRPSGTEPKTKVYIEVVANPLGKDATTLDLEKQKQRCREFRNKIKKAFLKEAYNILDIKMPERGYLLSDLLSVEQKVKYFEVEKNLLALKDRYNKKQIGLGEYKKRMENALTFFGKDPVEKIDACFMAAQGFSLMEQSS